MSASTLASAARRKRRPADSLARIDSLDDWQILFSRPGHHTVARTETVKFLIDLDNDDRTYFVDSKKWEVHFDFVRRFIDPHVDYDRFNIREYAHDDRRFLLGSLMHYLDGDHWTLELAGGDTLAADRIVWMFEHVSARLGIGVDLKFRPVSPVQMEHAKAFAGRLPVLSSDALNASMSYQPVVLGVAFGHVRLVRGTLDVSELRPYDLVVSEHVPEQIPPVAGLVTSQLQAPLAHVAVLSRNRNTPDMALRGAIDLDAFKRFEGQIVKLTVASQEYSVELAERAEAEAAWAAMRPAAALRPECDAQVRGMFDVARLPADAIRFVGAKAAQMGRLCEIEGITTPGGFAIPFAAYLAHLESAGLDNQIGAMLSNVEFIGNTAVRAQQLSHLRAAIVARPVDPNLLATLMERIRSLGGARRLILRSSTNAEDLDGFNGAGLYESVEVVADPTSDQVAAALRQVWASVWLQRAFEEREWYRIDHRAVAMGVLVQPFVHDAVATGVAITGNPFKQGLDAVFINTQVSGSTVTGALDNQLPEQYLVATWAGAYEPELLSRSSLTQGADILGNTELQELTTQLLHIHRIMLAQKTGSANAMDVEFALTAQRRFVMLQARPYTIVYSLDRAKRPRREFSLTERVMGRLRKLAHRLRTACSSRNGTKRSLAAPQGTR